MNKVKESKEDKISRIATAIANTDIGDSVNPTNLARSIKIHPNTYRDTMDLFDTLREIGFRNIRDKNGKLKATIRTDENLDTRKEIREMRKDLLDIKNTLDEIKTKLKRKSKKK